MARIIEQGMFTAYEKSSLDEARSSGYKSSAYQGKKTLVFISHKHDDLSDLKGVLGFLEDKYGVIVYIDSQDTTMPKSTSALTALNLKERIRACDKFILLATNNAIESKWCNWELGFGDALKYREHIALFPMKPKGSQDHDYRGSEYLQIYPYIIFSDGTEKFKDGQTISKGLYVVTYSNEELYYQALNSWFSSR